MLPLHLPLRRRGKETNTGGTLDLMERRPLEGPHSQARDRRRCCPCPCACGRAAREQRRLRDGVPSGDHAARPAPLSKYYVATYMLSPRVAWLVASRVLRGGRIGMGKSIGMGT